MKQFSNYRVGVAKRKFKMGKADFEPGTLINNLKSQKVAQNKEKSGVSRETKVAIMGLV